ncbi:hypothetical protein ACFQ1E_04285 [Sphingomonas canadensis]|uniref:Glycerophosphoryl diester phosphodiesterase membrane domain-containing protein n=1 Tax=Sphingomonas canadensis TaxID=1219257 RepID=A0ABW3H291_9SPHN|nr:hypothetical protein [Sphingomonas canadensis]MCW3834537.1 hypothetical protein [Sphingomonas canadensis]
MTTVGTILGDAFGLIARRPGAVLIWVLVYVAVGLAGAALVLGQMPQMFEAMQHIDPENPAGAQMAMMNGMGRFQGLSLLIQFGGVLLTSVVLCAAFRALLRPEEDGFGYLRLGWDELRTFFTYAVIVIAAIILGFILMLMLFMLTGLVAVITRDSPATGGIVGFLLAVAALCLVIWVMVRLSLIYAVSFLRGRLSIDEAWAATRGRFWTLFLAYLLIAIFWIVLNTIMSIPLLFSLFGGMASLVPADPSAEPDPKLVFAFMQQWFAANMGLLLAVSALAYAVQGLMTALFGGAMASAARGFLTDDGHAMPQDFDPEG